MPAQPLVLIGPMASGKSRTGRRLARRLDLSFADTDTLFEKRFGEIRSYFDAYGEAAFRAAEREVVRDAIAAGGVIATGGGAILHPDTQRDLAACAVAYLSISAEAVAARIASDTKRPLLVSGGVEQWSAIYEQRRALYEQLGTIHIDTSHRPMEAIADELAAWYRSRYGGETA